MNPKAIFPTIKDSCEYKMTIANFGKITPLQMGVLMLSGYHLTRERGRTEMLQSINPEDTLEAMTEGRLLLQNMTGQGFGASLTEWHAFLQSSEDYRDEYMQHSTWPGVERAVATELQNPDRARLEALAKQKP